ncbi:hypothetical protein C122C_0820 [Leuconostoc gelidum subsp. gasicomitatum]|uniref:Prophage pi2 protein 40 n=1 Tax=Leuconostoc gasicomitatum TaxID=115778 RepID=A0ABM9V3V9_9LACO|nr:hypothetical protein [Leuconostoc gasicomitatum]CUW10581.1 hypothetical protein C122C_0820 [Leuconostoc gasicomitatum]
MEKTINISGNEVRLISSGATPIIYKNAFGRDFFSDLGTFLKLADTSSKAKKGQEMSALLSLFSNGDITIMYNFVWIYAKNADMNLKPLEEWLTGFEEFPMFDFLGDVMDLVMRSVSTKKA